jgi:uncharacterized membrane protein YphA (DoxX/SURF4 family)
MKLQDSKPRLALRALTGLTFIATGALKLLVLGPAAVTEFFAAAHIPLPAANAIFVPAIELACGLGLLLGAFVAPLARLTRLFAFVLAGDMAVAILTVGIGAATGHPVIVRGQPVANEPWRLPLEASLLLLMAFLTWRPRPRES